MLLPRPSPFVRADQVAYLNLIVCEELLLPSPLRNAVFRVRLPSVYCLEGIELGKHEHLTVWCGIILNYSRDRYMGQGNEISTATKHNINGADRNRTGGLLLAKRLC